MTGEGAGALIIVIILIAVLLALPEIDKRRGRYPRDWDNEGDQR